MFWMPYLRKKRREVRRRELRKRELKRRELRRREERGINAQNLCRPPDMEEDVQCQSLSDKPATWAQNSPLTNTNLKQQRYLFFKYYVLSI